MSAIISVRVSDSEQELLNKAAAIPDDAEIRSAEGGADPNA